MGAAKYWTFIFFVALFGVAESAPSDWREVKAGHAFTMQAPAGTTFRREQGIDSFASGFDGPGFKMDFDFGTYSNTLSGYERDGNFAVEHTEIDGNAALIVNGVARGGDFGCAKFIVAAHIKTKSKGFGGMPNSLTIGACVSDRNKIPAVEQMFRSIRFNN